MFPLRFYPHQRRHQHQQQHHRHCFRHQYRTSTACTTCHRNPYPPHTFPRYRRTSSILPGTSESREPAGVETTCPRTLPPRESATSTCKSSKGVSSKSTRSHWRDPRASSRGRRAPSTESPILDSGPRFASIPSIGARPPRSKRKSIWRGERGTLARGRGSTSWSGNGIANRSAGWTRAAVPWRRWRRHPPWWRCPGRRNVGTIVSN
mmetsp:Transcript_27332/g.65691  ORF Transcript_27332/g.65691 Transcript_27332/m.65691 type:complete len:207 (-) Transcript_27332:477-1097(-)